MITQKRLRLIFDYDPRNKAQPFIWKVSPARSVKAGTRAGSGQSKGYYQVMIEGKQYLIHRLVWLWHKGKFPHKDLDHINHRKDDNRIKNLREVTNRENHRNISKQCNNTSGITGVSWNKQKRKWRAQINIDGKRCHLGLFDKKEDAAVMYRCIAFAYGFHDNHGK